MNWNISRRAISSASLPISSSLQKRNSRTRSSPLSYENCRGLWFPDPRPTVSFLFMDRQIRDEETERRISCETRINKSSFGLHVSRRRNITITGMRSTQGWVSLAKTPGYPGHVQRGRAAVTPTRLRQYTEICLSRLMRMHALLPAEWIEESENRDIISSSLPLTVCMYTSVSVGSEYFHLDDQPLTEWIIIITTLAQQLSIRSIFCRKKNFFLSANSIQIKLSLEGWRYDRSKNDKVDWS